AFNTRYAMLFLQLINRFRFSPISLNPFILITLFNNLFDQLPITHFHFVYFIQGIYNLFLLIVMPNYESIGIGRITEVIPVSIIIKYSYFFICNLPKLQIVEWYDTGADCFT